MISAADAFAERAHVVLVDVRSPGEQAVSMLPGAVTRAEFERQYVAADGRALALPPDTLVAAYCERCCFCRL